jgi:energy-coupling factor transporter ATP-binding protein EcfA2
MLKLRRLRVDKFRSLAKNAALVFSDGVNVLLGQNGTGKTTLLDLISMVVRSDFSGLAKEEFAIEYELAVTDAVTVTITVRNDRLVPTHPAALELRTPDIFRPSAKVSKKGDPLSLVEYDAEHGLTIRDRPPVGPTEAFSPLEPSFLLFYVGDADEGDLGDLLKYLLKSDSAQRLDESLDLFRKLVGQTSPVGEILVDDRLWHSTPSGLSLLPDSLVQRLRVVHKPGKPDYAFEDVDVPLLATLKVIMGFKRAELRVDATEQQDRNLSIKISSLVFRFWWEDGTFITHERLSYGQKRLVAFFYYLACNPDIVIADELVNGLHHRWITASIEAIGPRQAFLTSQNPLLLDYLPITSAEEVRRSFVLCRGEPRAGRPGWIWENMSESDAEELFSAYGVGVEHVSEILQSRGLW